MRWVYIDEAGISAREKVVTVAGVVIDADRHHRALAGRLQAIRDALPGDLGRDLIFHAKDIWHGTDQFDRKRWEAHGIFKDERRSLVDQICSIPAEFDLPVIDGVVSKGANNWASLARELAIPNLTGNRLSYAVAFGQCVVDAEVFLRDRCPEEEVGQIVAEDTNEMRAHAEWAYSLLERENAPWSADINHYIPLKKLTEGPQFVSKKRSPILQIADSLAFVINRHTTLGAYDSDVGHCHKRLTPQKVWPKDWSDFDYF